MTALRIAIALPLGLAFGSFLTVVVHRVPRAESVVHRVRGVRVAASRFGRSTTSRSCPGSAGEVPGLRARISPIYPLLELGSGALFVAVVLGVEDPWPSDLEAPFAALLLAIGVIDWRTKKIPNAIVYPSSSSGPEPSWWHAWRGRRWTVLRAGLGLVIYGGGLLILAFIAPRGMGMGDVKLAVLIGLVLGAHGLSDVAVAAEAGIALGGVAAGNPMRPCSAGHRERPSWCRARRPRAPPASDRESNSAAAPGHGHGEQPTVHAERTSDRSVTRQLTGSNVLSTSTSSSAPNPCIPPSGTVPS